MLTLITPPAIEPVTLQEAKDQLRVTTSDDDARIDRLIRTARSWAESYTARAFITQTWELQLNAFPCASAIALPNPPLLAVDSVKYLDDSGVEQTFSADNYTVATPAGPHCQEGYLYLNDGVTWPITQPIQNAVRIRFQAGYGPGRGNVPPEIADAILMYVEHLYDRAAAPLTAAQNLLGPFRIIRF